MRSEKHVNAPAGDARYLNESVQKGMSVLIAIADAAAGLTAADVAAQVEIDYSTAYRLCSTLLALGYLNRDPVTKVFRPGPSVLRLGYAYVQGLEAHQAAAPIMREVCGRVKETVNLSTRDGTAMVLLDAVQPEHLLTTRIRVGARYPMHCSASGKVALAGLDDSSLKKLLASLRLERLTVHTITDRGQLEREVARVRAQGYAVNIEEHVLGLQAVAAPIYDHTGGVVAVIDIAVPSARIDSERPMDVIRNTVVGAAATITAALGGGGR